MKSIQVYLIAVLLSVICLSNFIAALQGYRSSSQAADALVDQLLVEKAQSLRIFVNKKIDLPSNIYDGNTLYQVWQGQQLLVKSNNAPMQRLTVASNRYHMISYNGLRWRSWVDQPVDSNYLIIVAQRYDVYSKLTEEILLKAIFPIIWVLPIIALLVWLVVHFGLGSLARLAKHLGARKTDDFSAIDGRQYPEEMTTIIGSLNNLFDRLLATFDRERRFSADAAHELRTPLAALKVGLHNLSNSLGKHSGLEQLTESVNRMGHSIEQILALQRLSSENALNDFKPCDLNLIAKTVISDLYLKLEAKSQSIELVAESAVVTGNPFALSVLLSNLIDNASKYTSDHGSIRVTIQQQEKQLRLVVEDAGVGIPESEHSRIVERFYRVGGDRHSSKVVGSGLGLSIVSHIVDLHQAELHFSTSKDLSGLAVEVLIPNHARNVRLAGV